MLARKALAGTAGAPKEYVEDVFSTYLYTGTGSTLSINNGIDLSGEGGMVWIKARSTAYIHCLYDTQRGALQTLTSNTTDASVSESGSLTAFNADGFTLGSFSQVNHSSNPTYVSWTFRKAKKFFDVVTYTGNGSPRNISHNLGSAPGCVIVKRTSSTGSWAVWHRSGNQTNGKYAAYLDDTGAYTDQATNLWGSESAAPDMNSSTFGVGTAGAVNSNGFTYVAYLFAHDAGGFGDAGSDNIISCGSWTQTGTGATINLGYEPQWILFKRADGVNNWRIIDNMRGMTVTEQDNMLYPNSSSAESAEAGIIPTATGFTTTNYFGTSGTFIYIAIRRGPMKTPTSGTDVFSPTRYTGTNVDNRLVNTGLLTDMFMARQVEDNNTPGFVVGDRLRGNPYLGTATTNAELNDADSLMTPTVGYGNAFSAMNGVGVGNDTTAGVNYNTSSNKTLAFAFKRAPGFFDVVCYTGTGSGSQTVTHNLGAVPELIITRSRGSSDDWYTYTSTTGNTKTLYLNYDIAASSASSNYWNNTSPTSTQFTAGPYRNGSANYVAYLFASVNGVSKVGSYTGNGSSVTVTTDFQPRFVLVKRTDSTGNWIVGDSASGLVAGNDPFMRLNVVGTENTSEDWIDVSSTGFTINETTANANVNTGTYIYLAIA